MSFLQEPWEIDFRKLVAAKKRRKVKKKSLEQALNEAAKDLEEHFKLRNKEGGWELDADLICHNVFQDVTGVALLS